MDVAAWCAQHGITKANYYYRLKRVRKACLDQLADTGHNIRILAYSAGSLKHQGVSMHLIKFHCAVELVGESHMPDTDTSECNKLRLVSKAVFNIISTYKYRKRQIIF